MAKRDINQLTETISGMKVGDLVRASFKHPRYGTFIIEGAVVQGRTRNQSNVGSWLLQDEGKAHRYLQELVVLASAGNHDRAAKPVSEAPEHFGAAA